MKKIILASQSPRRRELMEMLAMPFEVLVSDKEEIIKSTNPKEVTEELSRQKAEAVAETTDNGIIIGADTVVACDGKILGKPRDKKDAYDIIHSLQGRSHMVYTGVTIICKENGDKQIRTFSEGTKVKVSKMNEDEIRAYIETDEPYDKAGAYGIQGTFGKFIEGIEGDFYNVVGLPVSRLYREIRNLLLTEK